MENCTIYSHQLSFDKVVQIIKAKLPKATFDLTEEAEGGKCFTATIKGGLFGKSKTLTVRYRQRKNPSYQLDAIECGLTKNLTGMVNFIWSFPAKNEKLREKFIYKVSAANCEMPFMAEPGITPEFADIIKTVTGELDGFIFAQPNLFFRSLTGPSFLDKDLRLILDAQGNSQVADIAVVVDTKHADKPKEGYNEEQTARKNRSEKYLKEIGIKINANLPCVPSSSETRLRTTQEIVDRAYALLIVAAKGEGIKQETLNTKIKEKNINSFSPREMEIVRGENLPDEDLAQANWRHESLYLMLWALGKLDWKGPEALCDVKGVIETILFPDRKEFEATVNRRTVSEILDKLDLIYRVNWACVDAMLKEDVPDTMEPGVVHERHYSLNWLTHQGGEDWDDIRVNT